ncbi:MAG TPA: DUF4147 domain-containing protein [Thermoplasmata archaeon]|nr:DUF4147 domain-containing protein [Thermoplasmata archaeon]
MTLVADARGIFDAGVAAVDPGPAVRRSLRLTDRGTWVGRRRLVSAAPESVYVLAIGKAAARMADAAAMQLGRRLAGGMVVQRPGDPPPRRDWTLRSGSHPLPSRASERAARCAQQTVDGLRPDVALLVLLSGGGSALFEVPAPGLSLAEIRSTYARLLSSDLPIQAINLLRRHLSGVKGGLFAARAAPRPLATLAISDVVGDASHDIASGPTVPDPSTFSDALRAVRDGSLGDLLPPRVLAHLRSGRSGRIPDTPKPGDRVFRRSSFHLVGTNRIALSACAAEARRRGYDSRIATSTLTGDTQEAAREQLRRFGRVAVPQGPRARPLASLSGGETTVRLGPHPGRGGRNQEFALASAVVCDGWTSVAVLSAGSDGIDGPTDAAGGIVTGATASLARKRGLDLAGALQRHDAYTALRRLRALVVTGPTGTNVMDLHVLLAGPVPEAPSERAPRTRKA